MRLRTSRYVPKKQKNRLLDVLVTALLLSAVGMWIFRERLGLDVSSLCIYTGIMLIPVSFMSINKSKEKELHADDKQLEKMRDEIGKDSYHDNSIFYDEKK